MDGFTGFNPTEARNNIETTTEKLSNILCDGIISETNNFFGLVSKFWASPKAIEFGEKYTSELDTISRHFLLLIRSFSKKAVEAYDSYARVNGTPAFSGEFADKANNFVDLINETDANGETVIGTLYGELDLAAVQFKENLAGVVGINTLEIDNVCDDFFNVKVPAILSLFDEVNMSVAFYDPSGEVAAAYQNEVKALKEEASELFTNMANDIKQAIETERNTVMIAATQSADILSS